MNAWSFFSVLFWQAMIVAFFIYYRKWIVKLIDRIKSAKFGDKELTFTEREVERTEEQIGKEVADEIEQIIRKNGAHSFQWFREHTHIQFEDDEFADFIKSHPQRFKRVTIVDYDKDRNRIIPGRPGIKLESTNR